RAVREAGLAHCHRDEDVCLVLVVAEIGDAMAKNRADGRVGCEGRVLGNVSDAEALARGQRSRGRRLLARQDPQQGGLARAVGPHEPHVVPFEETERQALEERGGAEGLGEVPTGEEQLGHQACTPGASWPVRSTYST